MLFLCLRLCRLSVTALHQPPELEVRFVTLLASTGSFGRARPVERTRRHPPLRSPRDRRDDAQIVQQLLRRAQLTPGLRQLRPRFCYRASQLM